jgi:hypothetical protein
MTQLLSSLLSILYTGAIFLLADSPVVSDLARFNPYSLLHIPLYGILTFLLVLSFRPSKGVNLKDQANQTSQGSQINQANCSGPATQRPNDSMTPLSHGPKNLMTRILLPGAVAFLVAIADEIHQAYVPGRNSSITDVLLDMVGIILVILFINRLFGHWAGKSFRT